MKPINLSFDQMQKIKENDDSPEPQINKQLKQNQQKKMKEDFQVLTKEQNPNPNNNKNNNNNDYENEIFKQTIPEYEEFDIPECNDTQDLSCNLNQSLMGQQKQIFFNNSIRVFNQNKKKQFQNGNQKIESQSEGYQYSQQQQNQFSDYMLNDRYNIKSNNILSNLSFNDTISQSGQKNINKIQLSENYLEDSFEKSPNKNINDSYTHLKIIGSYRDCTKNIELSNLDDLIDFQIRDQIMDECKSNVEANEQTQQSIQFAPSNFNLLTISHHDKDNLSSFQSMNSIKTPTPTPDQDNNIVKKQKESKISKLDPRLVQFKLIKDIFDKNLSNFIKNIEMYKDYCDTQLDKRGNNVLLLLTKLSLKNKDYVTYICYFLQNQKSSIFKIKDLQGWYPIDWAVSHNSVRLTTLIFEQMYVNKLSQINEEKQKVMQQLKQSQDFYIEMKWNFESFIPFISYFAPSDVFKIWKVGDRIRLDSTLIGFHNLKCKRRNISIIFNPFVNNNNINNNNEDDQDLQIQVKNELITINHDKKIYFNSLEKLSIEEKKLMIDDLLLSDPTQSDFEILKIKVKEQRSMLGKQINKKYENFITNPYSLKLNYKVMIEKKKEEELPQFYEHFYSYIEQDKNDNNGGKNQQNSQKQIFNPLKSHKINNEKINSTSQNKTISSFNDSKLFLQEKNPQQQQFESLKNSQYTTMNLSMEKDMQEKLISNQQIEEKEIQIKNNKNVEEQIKKFKLQMNITKDHHLNINSLLPILKMLSMDNRMLHKIYVILERQEIKDLLDSSGFPVKLAIPVNFSIKGSVQFQNFQELDIQKDQDQISQIFSIPKDYSAVQRQVAQKTLIRSKKRMVWNNFILS